MAVPEFYLLMEPVLRTLASAGELMKRRISLNALQHLHLSDADMATIAGKGRLTQVEDRTGWALSYASMSALVESPKRGMWAVTPAGARAPWSPECWRALAELIVDIHRRQGVPLERDHVFTHSDAHPLSQTTPRGEPWDTVDAQWSWERLETEVGLPTKHD